MSSGRSLALTVRPLLFRQPPPTVNGLRNAKPNGVSAARLLLSSVHFRLADLTVRDKGIYASLRELVAIAIHAVAQRVALKPILAAVGLVVLVAARLCCIVSFPPQPLWKVPGRRRPDLFLRSRLTNANGARSGPISRVCQRDQSSTALRICSSAKPYVYEACSQADHAAQRLPLNLRL